MAKTVAEVGVTIAHTWPYLAFSVLVAAILKVHVEPARVRAWLSRHQRASVVGAVVISVATPLCSCGTMALVLAMLATSMPWAPIVAFMVASPLSSPGQLLYTAGLFGWTFAGFHLGVAIVLGFAGAAAAALLESRGWLANQTPSGSGRCAGDLRRERRRGARRRSGRGPTSAVAIWPVRGARCSPRAGGSASCSLLRRLPYSTT